MTIEQDKVFGECRRTHGYDPSHHTYACYGCVENHVEKMYRIILAVSKLPCEREVSGEADIFFTPCQCPVCKAVAFVEGE